MHRAREAVALKMATLMILITLGLSMASGQDKATPPNKKVVEGTITILQRETNEFVLATSEGNKFIFRMPADGKIRTQDKEASWADLEAGMKATVSYEIADGRYAVISVNATRQGKPASTDKAGEPEADAVPITAKGRIHEVASDLKTMTIKTLDDKEVALRIDDEMRYRLKNSKTGVTNLGKGSEVTALYIFKNGENVLVGLRDLVDQPADPDKTVADPKSPPVAPGAKSTNLTNAPIVNAPGGGPFVPGGFLIGGNASGQNAQVIAGKIVRIRGDMVFLATAPVVNQGVGNLPGNQQQSPLGGNPPLNQGPGGQQQPPLAGNPPLNQGPGGQQQPPLAGNPPRNQGQQGKSGTAGLPQNTPPVQGPANPPVLNQGQQGKSGTAGLPQNTPPAQVPAIPPVLNKGQQGKSGTAGLPQNTPPAQVPAIPPVLNKVQQGKSGTAGLPQNTPPVQLPANPPVLNQGQQGSSGTAELPQNIPGDGQGNLGQFAPGGEFFVLMAPGSREPLYVDQQTKILVNNQAARFADLQPGAEANISVQMRDGIRHVRQILANSAARPVNGGQVPPNTTINNNQGTGQTPPVNKGSSKQAPGGSGPNQPPPPQPPAGPNQPQPPGGPNQPQPGPNQPGDIRAGDAISGRILRNKGDLLVLATTQGDLFAVMSVNSREPLMLDQGTRFQVNGNNAAFTDLQPGADAMVLFAFANTNIRRVIAVSTTSGFFSGGDFQGQQQQPAGQIPPAGVPPQNR